MPIVVNLRHLEAHDLHLEGELLEEELDIETHDEIIQIGGPLRYDLAVQKMEDALLVQGSLRLSLRCQCVRCLKPFEHELDLLSWNCHVPLHGEDAAPVVNDCVDLTPLVREDILLEFPQHPVCDVKCRGLLEPSVVKSLGSAKTVQNQSAAWSKLNKLKL